MKEKDANPFNRGKTWPFWGRSEITEEQGFPGVSARAGSGTRRLCRAPELLLSSLGLCVRLLASKF